MGKMLLVDPPKRIFLTANDKRNRFACLMPIFVEQLDKYLDMPVFNNSLNSEVNEVISEIINRLEHLFRKASFGERFKLNENSNFQELIACLKSFKEVPISIAGPGDLTYINVRLEKLINFVG